MLALASVKEFEGPEDGVVPPARLLALDCQRCLVALPEGEDWVSILSGRMVFILVRLSLPDCTSKRDPRRTVLSGVAWLSQSGCESRERSFGWRALPDDEDASRAPPPSGFV